MDIILWAHRQRLSESQTHKAPAAAVPCVGGDRREQPTINAPRPSPFARLRRTRPTLTNIPNTLGIPSQSCLLPPPAVPPYGQGAAPPAVQPLTGTGAPSPLLGAGSSPTQLPNLTQSKKRPTHSNARQKTTTLRRSGSFGCGQQGTQRNGSAATAVYNFSGMPLPPCLAPQCALLPVPKALRPPLHLSKRYAAIVGQLPQMRDSVRPLCVQWPQLPPVGRVSADGAARVGQSSMYKSPGKGFSRKCRAIR